MSYKPTATTGVLIVDDHDGYRNIVSDVVEATDGFRLVAAAANRCEALTAMRQDGDKIGLVLLDVCLGDDDGVEVAAEFVLHQWPADVLLLSALDVVELPDQARTCGARGFLQKAEFGPDALRQVASGVYDWPHVNASYRSGRRS